MAFSNPILILAALGLLLATVTLLVLNDDAKWRPTKMIKSWIYRLLRSCPSTPPLSESSGGKGEALKQLPHTADYKDVLPPSTREGLPLAAKSLPETQRIKLKGQEVNQAEFTKNIIPFTANYKKCGPSTYTPMKISLEEVEALGDFPDYASLSGVPLPEPYMEFDITKAVARPYRPFRWAYHQTMCMLSFALPLSFISFGLSAIDQAMNQH